VHMWLVKEHLLGVKRKTSRIVRSAWSPARGWVQEAAGTLLKACSIKHWSAAVGLKLTPQHNLNEEVLSHPAWIAKRAEQDWTVYGFEEVVDDFGMTLIDWDGRYAYRLTIGVPDAYG